MSARNDPPVMTDAETAAAEAQKAAKRDEIRAEMEYYVREAAAAASPRPIPQRDEDDELPRLADDTQAILQEFLRSQANRGEVLQQLNAAPDRVSMAAFEENWQLSQFWYNQRTKSILADVCSLLKRPQPADNCGPELRIALLSCPSLYDDVRRANCGGIVHLYEFDTRFASYGPDFVHFDYTRGKEEDYLRERESQYDLIIVDPPFLSEECIDKMSHIVRRLRAQPTEGGDGVNADGGGKVILCSGRVVVDWAARFMQLGRCEFRPEHERNLGNDFASYANFDLDAMVAIVDKKY